MSKRAGNVNLVPFRLEACGKCQCRTPWCGSVRGMAIWYPFRVGACGEWQCSIPFEWKRAGSANVEPPGVEACGEWQSSTYRVQKPEKLWNSPKSWTWGDPPNVVRNRAQSANLEICPIGAWLGGLRRGAGGVRVGNRMIKAQIDATEQICLF